MKKTVLFVCRAVGTLALFGAGAGLFLGLVQLAPTAHDTTPCPFNFACSVAGVPTWVICLIPLALLLLIILLIVALARRRTIYSK